MIASHDDLAATDRVDLEIDALGFDAKYMADAGRQDHGNLR
jgi:hypothetical protein